MRYQCGAAVDAAGGWRDLGRAGGKQLSPGLLDSSRHCRCRGGSWP